MLTPSLAVCWRIPLDSQTLPIFQHCTQQINSIPSLPKVSSSPGHGPAQHRNPIQQTALEGTGWHEGNISDTFPAFLSIREARSPEEKANYNLCACLCTDFRVSTQGPAHCFPAGYRPGWREAGTLPVHLHSPHRSPSCNGGSCWVLWSWQRRKGR